MMDEERNLDWIASPEASEITERYIETEKEDARTVNAFVETMHEASQQARDLMFKSLQRMNKKGRDIIKKIIFRYGCLYGERVDNHHVMVDSKWLIGQTDNETTLEYAGDS